MHGNIKFMGLPCVQHAHFLSFHFQIDLQQIDEAFKTKHGKTLHQAVTSNYSGDFADLLLQLIEQNQTGQ